MDDIRTKLGYSAQIDMWLECDQLGPVPLSQVAPTFVIATTPVALPACNARIVLLVDGQKFERAVRLVNGMEAT
jgi:hypothetical protein